VVKFTLLLTEYQQELHWGCCYSKHCVNGRVGRQKSAPKRTMCWETRRYCTAQDKWRLVLAAHL